MLRDRPDRDFRRITNEPTSSKEYPLRQDSGGFICVEFLTVRVHFLHGPEIMVNVKKERDSKFLYVHNIQYALDEIRGGNGQNPRAWRRRAQKKKTSKPCVRELASLPAIFNAFHPTRNQHVGLVAVLLIIRTATETIRLCMYPCNVCLAGERRSEIIRGKRCRIGNLLAISASRILHLYSSRDVQGVRIGELLKTNPEDITYLNGQRQDDTYITRAAA